MASNHLCHAGTKALLFHIVIMFLKAFILMISPFHLCKEATSTPFIQRFTTAVDLLRIAASSQLCVCHKVKRLKVVLRYQRAKILRAVLASFAS
jgi:hypothetical protein